MDYIDRLMESIDDFEASAAELSKLNDILVSLRQVVENMKKDKGELSKSLDVNKKVYESLKTEADKLKQIRETLEELAKNNEFTANGVIAGINSQLIKNSKESIDAVSSVNSVISNKIQKAESNVESEINKNINAAKTEIEQEIDNLKKTIAESQKIINDAETAIKGEINTQKNKIIDFDKKIDELKENVEKTSDEIEALKRIVAENNEKVVELVEKAEKQQSEIDVLAKESKKMQIITIALVAVTLVVSIGMHFV